MLDANQTDAEDAALSSAYCVERAPEMANADQETK